MASRFDIVEFEDFDEDMLRDTIIACVSKAKWSLAPPPPGAREGLDTARIAARRLARGRNSPNFSNARSARTFVDAAFQRANARLAGASADFSAVANSTTLEASDVLGAPFHESSSRALRALDAMTGLAPVKAAVRGFVHAITENRTAELRGEPTLDLSLHRLFVGNPGTVRLSKDRWS